MNRSTEQAMILFWVVMLILSFVVPSHAFDTSLSVGTVIIDNKDVRNLSPEIIFRAGNLEDGVNLNIGYTSATTLMGGQQAYTVGLGMVGAEYTKKITDRLSGFVGAFVAIPLDINYEGSLSEAAKYKHADMLPGVEIPCWKDWEVEISDFNFGARAGGRYSLSGSWWMVGGEVYGRYLVVEETLYHSDPKVKAYWAARGQDAYHMTVDSVPLIGFVVALFGEIYF